MKRNCLGLVIAGLFFVLQPASASAKIDSTTNTNLVQGTTSTVTVRGQYVDLCRRFNESDNPSTVSGSGVTARKKATRSSEVEIEFTVAPDAAPGKRTVSLHYLVELSGFDKFDVTVLRKGRVTDVDVPSPTNFFQEVDVTLNGENIGNAGISVQFGSISGATAELRSSTDTRAVIRLRFPTVRAEATAGIVLFDKACGSTCPPFLSYTGLSDGVKTNVTIIGPNAVSSITFPDGSSVRVGSLLVIKIKLVRPAKAASTRPSPIVTIGSATRSGGETVHWQLVPSTGFEAAAGSGIAFSPTGLNQVPIPPGDEFVILTVKLNQVPSNCPQQGCLGRILTRMINLNTDQPPFFKQESFTMLPPN